MLRAKREERVQKDNLDYPLVADTNHMSYISKFGEKDVIYISAIQKLSAEITELKKEIEELKK